MYHTNDIEFTHRGHAVQVSLRTVPAEYQGVSDTIFTVLIDGRKIQVPGIWNAYKNASERGIVLVIMALLDGEPVATAIAPV